MTEAPVEPMPMAVVRQARLTEQLLSRREIYHGRIIDVQVDTVSLPNGNTSTREVVRHPGGVGILALDDEDCAVLVEQYRYVFGRTLLEIPAGKCKAGRESGKNFAFPSMQTGKNKVKYSQVSHTEEEQWTNRSINGCC